MEQGVSSALLAQMCHLSLQLQPAAELVGMGMLVPRAVCSAPAREQMPAVSRAVSHAPFISTKIQIS